MTQYGTWVSYGGDARIELAIGLLAVAGGVTWAGIRLPLPVRAAPPGPVGRIAMILAWVASIAAFLVCERGELTLGFVNDLGMPDFLVLGVLIARVPAPGSRYGCLSVVRGW